MVRTTSKLAYKQINEEGISANQKEVILNLLISKEANDPNHLNKGMSLREISRDTGYDINAVSGRVNDLKKDELVMTIWKRKCTISKRLINPVVSI